MGIAGGFARRILHRTPEKNVKGKGVEWRKWQSVRSYICGEEYNSVIAEEDSESVKSSEAIEPQPEQEKDHLSSEKSSTEISKERERYEQAARTIQSAFRNFQASCRKEKPDPSHEKQDLVRGTESSSRESLSSSIKAQVGISEDVFSVLEENTGLNRVHRRSKTEIFKLKEEWDDSTVSSNIAKMRMQSKLEATTRRERALAYAFSQQLRICSKRKQGQSSSMEADMGWSWLERWMATRIPDNSLRESPANKPFESINREQRSTIQKRIFDVIGEGKESCGSNEVSIQSENFTRKTSKETYKEQRLKATKTVSKRKTVPRQATEREYQGKKRDCLMVAGAEKMVLQIKSNDAHRKYCPISQVLSSSSF